MGPNAGSAPCSLCDVGGPLPFFEPQFLPRMGVAPSMIVVNIKQGNMKVKMPGP